MQDHLELIPHKVEAEIVQQRVRDGYVNTTAMCKAARRPWSRYWEARPSREFAEALSADIGISISELIQSVKGGDPAIGDRRSDFTGHLGPSAGCDSSSAMVLATICREGLAMGSALDVGEVAPRSLQPTVPP